MLPFLPYRERVIQDIDGDASSRSIPRFFFAPVVSHHTVVVASHRSARSAVSVAGW